MAPSRNPNRASTVYQGADGYWHGRVTVGVRDDGRPDRRHVMAKSKAMVVRKVRELEKLRDTGHMARAGQTWTLRTWLEHWLDNIARPNLRESSYSAYRVDGRGETHRSAFGPGRPRGPAPGRRRRRNHLGHRLVALPGHRLDQPQRRTPRPWLPPLARVSTTSGAQNNDEITCQEAKGDE
jgi:hypothetical protein